MKNVADPIMTVTMPSLNMSASDRKVQGVGTYSMNIHAHPAFPPLPSMFNIAAARRPENAPAREVAEKKMATRFPNSALQ